MAVFTGNRDGQGGAPCVLYNSDGKLCTGVRGDQKVSTNLYGRRLPISAKKNSDTVIAVFTSTIKKEFTS